MKFKQKYFFYNFKRAFYTNWQKYNLTSYVSQLSTMFLVILIVWITGSLLTIINEYFLGSKSEEGIIYYLRFFTLTIKTILSADFGDFENYTTLTLIFSIVMVIIGIVIIGLFTGQIISMLISVIEKNKYIPEKPFLFCFHEPILICNDSNKIINIVNEIKKSQLIENREIIIINENADKIEITDKNLFKNVFYLKGNPADRKVLLNALTNNSKSTKNKKEFFSANAIVLVDENSKSNYSDYKSIETGLALEAFNRKINTIVELRNPENNYYFNNTFIDELITVKEYGIKLLAQAALNNGITKVYDELLLKNYENNYAETINNSIFITPVKNITDQTAMVYSDLKNRLENNPSKNNIIIGFQKHIDEFEFQTISNDDSIKTLLNKVNKAGYIDQVNPPKTGDIVIGNCSITKKGDTILLSSQTKLNENDKIIYISKNKITKEL